MALALEGVAASRSTTLISQGPCVAMIVPAKLYSSCRGSAPFGCKVGNLGIKSSGPSGKRYRSPSIVCEAKEITTVAGPVNDATFKKLVLECELPVLVDFWAPWCGPCRMIDPVINELAERYAGKLRCFKLNTDESPQIATDYGIRSIPTIIIFKGGEKKDAVIGAVPKATLIGTIEKFLDS